MMQKELLSAVAIVLTFVGFYPYLRSIMQGQTKPHVFTWVIWGVTTLIVFFAQLADRGGAGAWPTGASAILTFYVAFLAYGRKSDIHVTRSDWVFFLLAVFSIPLWYWTSNPFSAVIILTAVDIFGSIPTFRQAYRQPFSENALFYFIMAIRSVVSIFALEHYSWTTILFPAVMAIMSIALMWLLVARRKQG